MSVLETLSVYDKLSQIEESCHLALNGSLKEVPLQPGRDAQVLNIKFHPPKKGLSYQEGQARLLHDLGNIELQAMELSLRTLIEFQDAPKVFREQLAELTLSEARHLRLCLEGLENLKYDWGYWPVHVALWDAVSDEDSILDRILIVHRYLEGSGLDAGQIIMNKLTGVQAPEVERAVRVIMSEEVGHVQFGSFWYKEICKKLELNPEDDFPERLQKISKKIPRRLEKINWELRKKAGFEDFELKALTQLQEWQRTPPEQNNFQPFQI